jgi:hypothetical protein
MVAIKTVGGGVLARGAKRICSTVCLEVEDVTINIPLARRINAT